MAWYGESYQLDWGGTLAGPSVDFDDWRNHFDDASHTVTAGDDVIVGSYADPADFTAFVDYTDPIAVRWTLEVAGGSGTLAVSAGVDPTWSYSNPAYASQGLGSLVVTGAGTYVTGALTGVDHAMLAAQSDAIIVRIQCVSGSIDIAQVKLRVWPAAGAAGAWVPAGDGTATGYQVERWNLLGVPDSEEDGTVLGAATDYTLYPDPEADDAALDAAVDARGALTSRVGDTASFASHNNVPTGTLAASSASAKATLFVLFTGVNEYYYTGDAGVSAGLGIIRARFDGATPQNVPLDFADPNEIQYETEAYVRPAGGGTLTPEFGGWTTAAFEGKFSTSVPFGAWPNESAVIYQQTISDDFTPSIDPDFGYSQMPYETPTAGAATGIAPGAEGESDSIVTVPFTGGRTLLVAAYAPGAITPASAALGVVEVDYFGDTVHGYEYLSSVAANVTNTGHLILFGPVEVYDPAAVAQSPRFYVKDLDGDMRPVGFGKPATETAVFKVPTAMGRYRDLTTTEYATYGPDTRPPGGCPLKVKRVDTAGEPWWDHVAWLVPETD